jgi:hypothetical protein
VNAADDAGAVGCARGGHTDSGVIDVLGVIARGRRDLDQPPE